MPLRNLIDDLTPQFNLFNYRIVSVIMLTLLALTVHWYNVTVRPIHPKRFLERKRVIIVIIWLFCFICAIPFSYYNILIIRKKSGKLLDH